MNRRHLLILAAVAALSACGDRITAVTNGVVTVRKQSNGIRIDNGTGTARAYIANDPNWLALASTSDLSLMAMCTTTDAACLRIPAHGSVVVPFSEVGGYGSSTKSVVVWTWRVLPEGAGGALQAVMDDAITLEF